MTKIKLTPQDFSFILKALSRWIDDLGEHPLDLQTLRMLEDKKVDPALKEALESLHGFIEDIMSSHKVL